MNQLSLFKTPLLSRRISISARRASPILPGSGRFYPPGTPSARPWRAMQQNSPPSNSTPRRTPSPAPSTIAGLPRAHARRLPVRGEVPTSHHPSQGSDRLRRRDHRFSGRDDASRSEARAAAARDAAVVGRGRVRTLAAFLQNLPTGFRCALEVRHQSWLAPATCRGSSDYSNSMPSPFAWCSTPGCLRWTRQPRRSSTSAGWAAATTSPTMTSRTCAIDREAELYRGRNKSRGYLKAGLVVDGYFNNHYQGHSPALGARAASKAARRHVNRCFASLGRAENCEGHRR